MNFEIDYSDFGSQDRAHYGEDPYGYEWSEDHDYQYHGALLVDKGYNDVSLFPGEKPVEIGDDIHVVYACYDTGDSFGREVGKRTHLWAFSDRKNAFEFADAIKEDAVSKPEYDYDNTPLEFKGVPVNTNEWKGYFENFVCADVVTLIVRRNKSR